MRSLERQLVRAVTDGLRRQGLRVAVRTHPPEDDEPLPGALEVQWQDGRHIFPIVVKPRLEPWTVPLLPVLRGGVVVTDYASPKLRQALVDAGWGFVDGAGNASLTAPGLHVRVAGNRPQQESTPSATLPLTKTGLPVTFVLLVREGMEQVGTQRDLSELAQRSLGSTNRVLQALRAQGHLTEDGKLTKPSRLRNLWTEAYLFHKELGAPHRKFDSDRWVAPRELLAAELPQGVHLSSEAAASALGLSIRPETAMLYCPAETRKDMVREGRLRAKPDGWIELRVPFWGSALLDANARTVPDLLIRADLLAEADPRLISLAEEMAH